MSATNVPKPKREGTRRKIEKVFGLPKDSDIPQLIHDDSIRRQKLAWEELQTQSQPQEAAPSGTSGAKLQTQPQEAAPADSSGAMSPLLPPVALPGEVPPDLTLPPTQSAIASPTRTPDLLSTRRDEPVALSGLAIDSPKSPPPVSNHRRLSIHGPAPVAPPTIRLDAPAPQPKQSRCKVC